MKKKWYHLTNNYYGERFKAGLQVPVYVKAEPKVPRLCVGPDLPHCFAARLFDDKIVHVYSVECNTVKPTDLWDQVITQERWVIHPAELHWESFVDSDTVARIQCATWLYLWAGAKDVNFWIRLCQLATAQHYLDGRIRKWLSGYLFEKKGIINPEDYIVEQAEKKIVVLKGAKK